MVHSPKHNSFSADCLIVFIRDKPFISPLAEKIKTRKQLKGRPTLESLFHLCPVVWTFGWVNIFEPVFFSVKLRGKNVS